MRLLESRRITGRHLLLPSAGAAAEVEDVDDATLARWSARVAELARTLGWSSETTIRRWAGGASVAMTAPVDQLDTATFVVEAGFEDGPLPDLREAAGREASPRLRALLARPDVYADEDGFTAGLGVRSRTWPLTALPESLGEVGRIPFVYVTGTNGKTTTTRWIARMAQRAGLVAGFTSSDGIVVNGETRETGDWSGPGAARRLLREGDLEFAVLETARGGLLRRGLALDGADAAVVTNVTPDHFGEWGIDDLEGMAAVKIGVAYGVRAGGTVVLNADSPPLRAAAAGVSRARPDLRIAWFSAVDRADACVLDGVVHLRGEPLVAVADIPLTLGGRARHNVENALAAALAADACGVPRAAIIDALTTFRPTAADSRGRTNVYDVHGAQVLLDFAHNPDGIARIAALARAWPAARRLLLLGVSGDRTDALIHGTVVAAAACGADRVLVKELPDHLRGRAPGEVPARIEAELRALGVTAVTQVEDEVAGVRAALAWARPGDLLILLIHERVDDVEALLAAAGATAGL